MDSSIIASLIVSISGIIISFILAIMFGYIPRKRKYEITSLQKELLRLYTDVLEFHKLENDLLKKSNISKIIARKNLRISRFSESSKVQKRIMELKQKIE
jgi:hypothetical protein